MAYKNNNPPAASSSPRKQHDNQSTLYNSLTLSLAHNIITAIVSSHSTDIEVI